MNLFDILGALQAKNWWMLALIGTVYLRHLFSDKATGFPISVPARWLPSITAGLTVLYGVVTLQLAHATPLVTVAASLGAATATGLIDGLLIAMWGADPMKAPWWARLIARVTKDVGSASVLVQEPVAGKEIVHQKDVVVPKDPGKDPEA